MDQIRNTHSTKKINIFLLFLFFFTWATANIGFVILSWFQAWNHWKRFKINKNGWKRLKKVVWPAFRCTQHPKAGQIHVESNILLNRLCCLNNVIPQTWTSESYLSYKLKCKNSFSLPQHSNHKQINNLLLGTKQAPYDHCQSM